MRAGLAPVAWLLGERATSAGLLSVQFQRLAADGVPLMIAWICRTVDAPSGLQVCGLHSSLTQSWSPSVECFSVTACRRTCAASADLVVEALDRVCVDLLDRNLAQRWTDVALDVVHVPGAGAAFDLSGLHPLVDREAEQDR